ncbi:hypothetical protein IV57_GL002499 [Companilactobacillus kimchiensis]|uniref:WxL domain-containing protein n=2 Tax=Companilactobacillus kimchiensis TaxID=993692 RepID=A0A0R2LCN0_9LACO|nr:hypothetical protein IV57_GL002499 [Companilactobacillus kimchiensis]
MVLSSSNSLIVFADSDDSAAMAQAPDGVPVGQYFSILDPMKPASADENYPFMHNSAKISSDNSDIVVLAQGTKRDTDVKDGMYGAVWSEMNKDNYIDISKKQTISTWLYFGSGNIADPTINGEGISLVLHNDNRKNSSNQSRALGAGYQALGSLGYDQSTVPYIYRLYGLTKTYKSAKLPSPDGVAKTAIQNSIALDFDTQRNDTDSGSSLNSPINLFQTSPDYNFSGTATGVTDYTLNGFDTVDTSDPFGRNISKDYPGYNDLIAQRPLGQYSLRQGNSGGYGYGMISTTYPGNPLTYQLGLLSSKNGDYSYFSSGKKAMAAVQAYAKAASLVDGSYSNNKPIYWHHVTFVWDPARDANGVPTKDGMPVTGGTPASINYKFNDKMPDGSTNTSASSYYSEVDDSIPVDPTQFNLTGGNTKVYWGLTGANSDNDSVYSKMAIFESIPALATATVSSRIVDHSLNDQIITDDKDTTTVPNSIVFNDDKLTFNYNLKFDPDSSHQNWNDIVSKIDLPNADINFTQPGTITYHTNAGQSDDKTETIPLDWQTEDKDQLQHKLAHSLGTFVDATNNPNQYTSADINFDGTAVNKTDTLITVDPKSSVFTGSNAIESTSSPKFYIDNTSGNNQQLQLEVSNDLAFQNINYQVTNPLIHRATPFTLNVTSLKSPWILQASTNGMYLNGTGSKFNGDLIYKKNATDNPLTLSNTPQEIDSDSNSYDDVTTSQLAKNWTDETGLLLKPTAANNQAGKYTGTVTWEVINGPSNTNKD